jgi:hypothetical protein
VWKQAHCASKDTAILQIWLRPWRFILDCGERAIVE